MPTWLGILLLGSLFGGRRRNLGRSLLFGGLLGWLFHRNFDTDEMGKDLHRAGRKVRKVVRNVKHEFRDLGRAVREQARQKADEQVDAALERVEASQARDEERRRNTEEKIAAAHEALRRREELKAERANSTLEKLEAVRARRVERQQEIAEHLGAVRAEIAERKAEREQRKAVPETAAVPVQETVPAAEKEVHAAPVLDYNPNEELVAELERNARTAAMAADVPTIHFPEEDGKYNASDKYLYHCD